MVTIMIDTLFDRLDHVARLILADKDIWVGEANRAYLRARLARGDWLHSDLGRLREMLPQRYHRWLDLGTPVE
jgi:hypothetical protein